MEAALLRSNRQLMVVVLASVVLSVLPFTVVGQARVYYFNDVGYVFPSADGSSGTHLTTDGAGTLSWAAASSPEGLWAGSVVLSTVACATGYTESASGRYLVARPAGGTANGTVGTALTDLENRTHVHAGPNHTHTVGDHTHTGGEHFHTAGSYAVASHTHSVSGTTSSASGSEIPAGSGIVAVSQFSHDHTFSVTSGSASPGLSGQSGLGGLVSTSSNGGGNTGAAGTANTGTASAMIAPYVQLIVCVKD